MQKARLIVLLVVVSILALSLPSMAQLASGNWPRPGRDYHNSGLSPATAIAKPVLKSWAPKKVAEYNASPYYWMDFTFDAIQIDPQGNLYVQGDDEFSVMKFSSTGTYLWGTSVVPHNYYYMYFGACIFDDGTNQYLIAGPQQVNSALTTDDRKVYAINPSTGAGAWASGLLTDSWHVSYNITAKNTLRTGLTTNSTTSVGPDGTIYTGNFRDQFFDPVGSVFALNKDGSRKWAWNQYGQGDTYGSAAIKQLNGKNVLYTASGIYYKDAMGLYSGYAAQPNILALQDDGTSASLLWSANLGFVTSQPVLSADGNTLYVAGRESQPSGCDVAGATGVIGRYCDKNFFALDANTGTLKWSLNTGARHAFSPSLGPDGTVYVCGGYLRTAIQSSGTPDVNPTALTGELIAVKDNGATGEIKWTLPLPDDEDSDTTRVAVISSTPTTMYVATGNGRVYCIQDMGTYAKILWTWQAFSTRWCGVWGHGFTPANIAIDDNGTVYTGWRNYIYAFDTGFDAASPEGISGTVKDAAGNPIAGAWVAASTSVRPLADNANRMWTKTNSDGTYQISPKDAGTYYVAAAAKGYEGSEDQTAAFTTTSTKVIGVNFTLSPAKYNWAIGSAASATSVNTSNPAPLACDGDLTTRYASTATSSALTIDLGAEKTISEAVIYWWFNYGKAYTLQYSTDNSTYTTVYTTTTGNGGFPLDWYAGDPTKSGYNGGPKTSADVIKFAPITARYWQVSFTSVKNFYGDSYRTNGSLAQTVYGSTATYASIWDVELRDNTRAGEPVPNTIPAARSAQDGDGVVLSNVYVTTVAGGGVPTDTFFVETAGRTAGIKVQMTGLTNAIQFGDKVNVAGRIYTDATTGEKYIQGYATRMDSTTCPASPALAELSMNNKAAADDLSQGLFIKTWGKVSGSTTGSFTITDGSAAPIKVLCDSTGLITMPADGDYVRVRGVVGKDSTGPVLYMRNERADWAYASDDMQALPFTGNYDYPIQYLVLGPFTDSNVTSNYYQLLDEDFIGGESSTTGTIIGSTVMPKEGMVTAGKTWFAAASTGPSLDLNKVFGATTAHAVAYCHLYLWSDTDQPTVAITTGSDDWLRVYVNGAWQYDVDEGTFPTGRGVTIGQDAPQLITLNKGLNSILFKVVNGETGFGLNSQFIDGSFISGTSGYGGYLPYTTTALGYSLNPAQ